MNRTRIANVRRHTRNVLSMIVVAGALLAGAPGAQAAGGPLEPGRYRNAYQTATLSAQAPDENGVLNGPVLYAFRSNQGTQVCVENTVTGAGDTIWEYGCAAVADTAFSLDKKLASASVAPITVTLEQIECQKEGECNVISSRDVQVQASLAGEGPLQKMRSRSSFNDGACSYKFKGTAHVRTASGTLTFNDQALIGSGSMTDAKDLTVVKCD